MEKIEPKPISFIGTLIKIARKEPVFVIPEQFIDNEYIQTGSEFYLKASNGKESIIFILEFPKTSKPSKIIEFSNNNEQKQEAKDNGEKENSEKENIE